MQNLSEFIFKLRMNKSFALFVFFISYATGLFSFYSPKTLFIATIFTFLFLVLSLFILTNKRLKILSGYIPLILLYSFFIIGFLNAKAHYKYEDDFSDIERLKDAQLTGYVKTIPKYNSKTNVYKFPLIVKYANLAGKNYDISDTTVLVTIAKKKNTDIKVGDLIAIKGVINTPNRSYNEGQFDYSKFLKTRGINKTFYVRTGDYKLIKKPEFSDILYAKSTNKYNTFKRALTRYMNDIRDNVITRHSKYIKSPKLEILGGIVFGDDAVNPPDDIRETFVNSGLLHLLAASGLNVALILSMWLFVIYYINISYRYKIISGMVLVFLYSLMTGFPPSIVRASVMFMLILIGKLIYREAEGFSLIIMAGFMILLFKPSYITDVGFQLSYLVTFGLIVCMPCISHLSEKYQKSYLKKIKNLPDFIKSLLIAISPSAIIGAVFVPVVAQIWASPLQAYYFNTFSTYTILANVAVVPFIGIISFLGFISTAFCSIPFADKILEFTDVILDYIIGILLHISNTFSNLPNSIIRVAEPSIPSIIAFYLFAVSFFYSVKFLFKRKTLNILTLILFAVFAVFSVHLPDKSSSVTFFSVGNADSFLIKTPENKYILIDTGKSGHFGLSSANAVILPYFYDKNIKEIDTLIVTHYDSDHSGGLIDILDNIKVKNLVINEPECTSKTTCEIKDYILNNKIKYITPYNGQKFEYKPDITITNFTPKTDYKKSRNDFSTVTTADISGVKFLFMADAPIRAYKSIRGFLKRDIDVLKCAHHGAKNTVNKSMMKDLTPEYSILSSGKNSYGHPDRETVRILNKYSKVLSTKDSGAIKFVIKDKMKIYIYNPDTESYRELREQTAL